MTGFIPLLLMVFSLARLMEKPATQPGPVLGLGPGPVMPPVLSNIPGIVTVDESGPNVLVPRRIFPGTIPLYPGGPTPIQEFHWNRLMNLRQNAHDWIQPGGGGRSPAPGTKYEGPIRPNPPRNI